MTLQAAMILTVSARDFLPASLEGAVIATRDEANAEYYGKPVNAKDILAGK